MSSDDPFIIDTNSDDKQQELVLEFEDNFSTTSIVEEQTDDEVKKVTFNKLPDSENYLKSLENKLRKIKNNQTTLQQLAERREQCMRSLLSGSTRFEENLILEEPLNCSELIRYIRPEQAHTQAEVVNLVKYDQLEQQQESDSEQKQQQEENSDSSTSR
uniref:Protein aael aael001860 aedes aegypti n=1 Tax=Corethrella appendiculata TaxID=1370023 RepID=U5ESD8_9DIPT